MISLNIDFASLEELPRFLQLDARDQLSIRISAANAVKDSVAARFRAREGQLWWQQAALNTHRVRYGDQEAVVVFQRGVRLQWLGLDPNTPKHAKLLSIPARKSITEQPRAYSNLVAIFPSPSPGPKLRGWLAEGEKAVAKRRYKDKPAGRQITRAVIRGGRLSIYFSLVSHTSHVPHPDVVPSAEELSEVAQRAVNRFLLLRDHQLL